MSVEFYYQVIILSKNSKMRSSRDICYGVKILEIFGEHWLKFVEKYKLINNWRIISIRQGKQRNMHARHFAVGPEKIDFLKVFTKILIFLIKISMENGLFRKVARNFLDYFCLCSESITFGREHQISTTNPFGFFFWWGEGTFPCFPSQC